MNTSHPLSPPLAGSELKKLLAEPQATSMCVSAHCNATTNIVAKETWPKAGTPGWEQYPALTQSHVYHKTGSAALLTLSATLARARQRWQGRKRQQQGALEKAALRRPATKRFQTSSLHRSTHTVLKEEKRS